MKTFANIKFIAMMSLFAIAGIFVVDSHAADLTLANADMQSEAVVQKKMEALDKLEPMSQLLTMTCGARKDGIPFTQEELAVMVLAGAASEKMQPEVCRIFKDTKFI